MLCATLGLSFWHAQLVLQLQHDALAPLDDDENEATASLSIENEPSDEVIITFGSAFYLIAVSALCNIAALVISQHT